MKHDAEHGSTDVVRRSPFGDNPVVGERGSDTERRIRDAALAVFAEHGYHDARVELISDAAGCSRPAFYQYFASKEDLFWRLADSFAVAMRDAADRAPCTTPDAAGLAALESWFADLVDVSVVNLPLMTTFQAAVRERAGDDFDYGHIGYGLGSAVLAGAPSGDELDQPALSNVVAGVLMRSIYYWRLGIGSLARPRFVAGIAATMHRLLHGPVTGVNVVATTGAPSGRPARWPAAPTDSTEQPTRPRGRQTRQTLLDAGRSVLQRHGYHATRVDDIAAEAGVSHGTFYRYFANTDDLFQVLAQETASELTALATSFPEPLTDEGIAEWLAGWLESYRTNGGVITAWQELDHENPEMARYSFDVAAAFFDRLTRIVHARGFGDPTVDALVLLSVVERVPFNAMVAGHLDPDEAIAAATVFIRRGLFGL